MAVIGQQAVRVFMCACHCKQIHFLLACCQTALCHRVPLGGTPGEATKHNDCRADTTSASLAGQWLNAITVARLLSLTLAGSSLASRLMTPSSCFITARSSASPTTRTAATWQQPQQQWHHNSSSSSSSTCYTGTHLRQQHTWRL